jgi:hypothetical protein
MLPKWEYYAGLGTAEWLGSGHKLFLLIADVSFWILGILYIADWVM